MTGAAAFVHFLISGAGAIVVLFGLGLWLMARPTARRRRAAFVAAAALYLLASSFQVAHAAAGLLARPFRPLQASDVPAGRTAVILLGSGTYTQRNWSDERYSVLDPVGAERTLEAARVFRLIAPAWIISSGGRLSAADPDEPAGAVMRDALIELGVPRARIVTETASRTTRDEATVIQSMLPSLQVDRLVLVTSAVHMRRSLGVFRSVGLDPIPAIAQPSPHNQTRGWRGVLPSTRGLEETDSVVHELLGLAYYRLRGWQ